MRRSEKDEAFRRALVANPRGTLDGSRLLEPLVDAVQPIRRPVG